MSTTLSSGKPPENAAILLTAPGTSAIAVIRLRGDKIPHFLAHFSKPIKPGRPIHGELREGDNVLDDPVICAGPYLKWIDVNVHGGRWVIASVFELARRLGFELFENPSPPLPTWVFEDANTEIEREVLAWLPLARTELAIRALLAQPTAWKTLEQIQLKVSDTFISILDDRAMEHLLNPPRVAIVGEPNVGKSTLANALFGRQRAITADVPGTTRDWVGEYADLGGLVVMLLDTPGQRETSDMIERAAIDASQRQIHSSQLVLHLLDATRKPASEIYPTAMTIINKCDQTPTWQLPSDALRISARSGDRIDSLRVAIQSFFGMDNIDTAAPRCWTPRQRALLKLRDIAGLIGPIIAPAK